MSAGYFVQAYKAKSARLVGQPTEGFGFVDEALAAARHLARWRAGIVVVCWGMTDAHSKARVISDAPRAAGEEADHGPAGK